MTDQHTNFCCEHAQDGSHKLCFPFDANGQQMDNLADLIPKTDDTYYVGENANPFKAFKGLILMDTADGKHYRIQVTNGTVNAVALD